MSKLTKRQLKEEFNKFLRENGCASKFYANLYHPKAKRWRKEILSFRQTGRMVLHDSEYKAIRYAFEWSESVEGHDFWEIKNRAWTTKYKELTA